MNGHNLKAAPSPEMSQRDRKSDNLVGGFARLQKAGHLLVQEHTWTSSVVRERQVRERAQPAPDVRAWANPAELAAPLKTRMHKTRTTPHRTDEHITKTQDKREREKWSEDTEDKE